MPARRRLRLVVLLATAAALPAVAAPAASARPTVAIANVMPLTAGGAPAATLTRGAVHAFRLRFAVAGTGAADAYVARARVELSHDGDRFTLRTARAGAIADGDWRYRLRGAVLTGGTFASGRYTVRYVVELLGPKGRVVARATRLRHIDVA